MRILSELRERAPALLFRSRQERELDEELRFHIEMQTEADVRAGMKPKEARRRALIKLGGVEQTKEGVRDARGMRWLVDLAKDLRYRVRTMRRRPGFPAVVVLTLALGIAANTTVFSAVNPYLLRELPYGDADRLVQLGQVDPVTGSDAARFSLPQYVDYRERSRAFEDMAAYRYGPRSLTGDGAPEQVMTGVVTGNMFSLLRSPRAGCWHRSPSACRLSTR